MAQRIVDLPLPLGPTTTLRLGPGRTSTSEYVRKLFMRMRTMLPGLNTAMAPPLAVEDDEDADAFFCPAMRTRRHACENAHNIIHQTKACGDDHFPVSAGTTQCLIR